MSTERAIAALELLRTHQHGYVQIEGRPPIVRERAKWLMDAGYVGLGIGAESFEEARGVWVTNRGYEWLRRHPPKEQPNPHAWLKEHLWERRPKLEPPRLIDEPGGVYWNRFASQWREGDQVWSYSYDGGPLALRAGLALVRDGEVVAEFVELQS